MPKKKARNSKQAKKQPKKQPKKPAKEAGAPRTSSRLLLLAEREAKREATRATVNDYVSVCHSSAAILRLLTFGKHLAKIVGVYLSDIQIAFLDDSAEVVSDDDDDVRSVDLSEHDSEDEFINDDEAEAAEVLVGGMLATPFAADDTDQDDDEEVPVPAKRPRKNALPTVETVAATAAAGTPSPPKRPVGRPCKNASDGAPKAKKAKTETNDGVERDLSVTMTRNGRDVDVRGLDLLKEWTESNPSVLNSVISTERGANEDNLHFQAVFRTIGIAPKALNYRLRVVLGWEEGYKIQVKTLKNTGLHCFDGMVGYTTKDYGLPHFKCCMKNITDDMVARGRRLYTQFGASSMKGRQELTPANIMLRAMTFYMFKCRKDGPSPTIGQVLLAMIQSGHFYPSGKWVVPYHGAGMDWARVSALWDMMISPRAAEISMINEVFFTAPQGRFRYHAPPCPVIDDMDWLENDHPPSIEELVSFVPPRVTPAAETAASPFSPPTTLRVFEDLRRDRLDFGKAAPTRRSPQALKNLNPSFLSAATADDFLNHLEETLGVEEEENAATDVEDAGEETGGTTTRPAGAMMRHLTALCRKRPRSSDGPGPDEAGPSNWAEIDADIIPLS